MSVFFLGLKKELLKLHESFEERSQSVSATSKLRAALESLAVDNGGMAKVAFDTRRINSETTVNPRRNLQNYQRTEPFISPEISQKIKNLFKVKTAADLIKGQFMGDPDWLDSNSRILCNAVDNTLRVEQKDYDFFKPQFDYLDELLYLRYRLATADIERLPEEEIKNILLSKDEKLMHKSLYANYGSREQINKISEQPLPMVKQPSYIQEDSLMEKLFGNVKANKENKNVKRSINITIADSIEPELVQAEAEKREVEIKPEE
jgi:hypothetical protein